MEGRADLRQAPDLDRRCEVTYGTSSAGPQVKDVFLMDDVSEVYEARLIPTSGIKGTDEQERRATSALLAVMAAVKEFGRGLCAPLGAPAGKLQTYIEVPFQFGEHKLYPDGVITVSRGSRSWTALVEVKTGRNVLRAEQLENYLTLARERGFQSVLTISNEMPAVTGQHPTAVDRKLRRRVSLHHLSWSQVLAAAVMQKEYRGVADPDQAWILGELIRYLEHDQSGAMEFTDMGPSWVSIREAVMASTFRQGDKGAAEVVTRFDALLTYISLRLGRQIGTDVAPELSRRELADPGLLHGWVTGGHAACVAGVVMMISYSMGVNRPSASCRRRRW